MAIHFCISISEHDYFCVDGSIAARHQGVRSPNARSSVRSNIFLDGRHVLNFCTYIPRYSQYMLYSFELRGVAVLFTASMRWKKNKRKRKLHYSRSFALVEVLFHIISYSIHVFVRGFYVRTEQILIHIPNIHTYDVNAYTLHNNITYVLRYDEGIRRLRR